MALPMRHRILRLNTGRARETTCCSPVPSLRPLGPRAKGYGEVIFWCFLVWAVAGLVAPPIVAAEAGFVSLFSGGDLSAWTMGPDKSWVVEDGLISLQREFDGKEHNGDYLWAKGTYGDFVLELEFKLPAQANSGVFLRTADVTDPVYTGIEVQIANSHGRSNLTRGGTAGAIYDCLAPSGNPVRPPGEWNALRVSCRGSRITVALNGEQIVDMDLDRWTEPHKNPDFSPNKFPRALKDFARQGHIGLQDHGRAVWYRNIRVRRLDSIPAEGSQP